MIYPKILIDDLFTDVKIIIKANPQTC